MKITLCLLLALCIAPVFASTDKPLAPLHTPYATIAAPADPAHFTFIVSGDNRSTGHGYPMPPCLNEICTEIGIIQPSFTLWTGDCIEGYSDTITEANAEYDTFLAGVSLTNSPVFSAPGNHEFGGVPDLVPVYKQRMGELYGSFDYGNSHFIALNTDPIVDGSVMEGEIDPEQMTWLQSDLAANQGAANIFVILHHYVFGPVDDKTGLDSGFTTAANRDALHQLLMKYHVRAVFCGHEHVYWHQRYGGIDYYISGGAGAPLDATPDQGGFLHYLTVTVDGSTITTQILQPWHLEVDYPDGDAKGLTTERAWVSNTNYVPVTANHIVLHMANAAAGQQYTAEASVSYKGKNKATDAKVVSVTPDVSAGNSVVVVSCLIPKARTVEITVSPH